MSSFLVLSHSTAQSAHTRVNLKTVPLKQANGCPPLTPSAGTTWRRGVRCWAEECDLDITVSTQCKGMALFRLCLVLSSIMATWCQTTQLVLLSTRGQHETQRNWSVRFGARRDFQGLITFLLARQRNEHPKEWSVTQSEHWHGFPRIPTSCLPISPEQSPCFYSLISVLPFLLGPGGCSIASLNCDREM